ncbi:MAG: AMP-binding protein, partial [Pseudomonadota bacterium]
MSTYHEIYQSWREAPEAFWAEAAKEIDWYTPWTQVFDPYAGQYGRWFVGAQCNTCYNCLDRHLPERADQAALIYDSPVTDSTRTYSYQELTDEVAALASVLQTQGIAKGDRVIIYMPMIPQAVMAMLACARIGAVHSVVFGGFAANELATRIEDSGAKAVLAASCGIEPGRVVAYKPLLDEAIELSAHKPEMCLVFQRPQAAAAMTAPRDLDWAQAVSTAMEAGQRADCVPVAATDPLYILYTSGTTGQPKGVIRDNGGHMVALKWSMSAMYDITPGETFWAASDVGWVVGHSYITYAPLLHGCATVVFEGKPVGTPDAGTFWRVIQDHKVASLFTAPTAFRAIRKEDPEATLLKNYDLSHFRSLFLAGERADPATIIWAEDNLQRPVIDHWWQTETGWTISGNPLGLGMLEVKRGSPAVPMPGYDIQVLDPDGNILPAGETGAICVRLPLPPGSLPTLWGDDERFRNSYLNSFPG